MQQWQKPTMDFPDEIRPPHATSWMAIFDTPGDFCQGFVIYCDLDKGLTKYRSTDPQGALVLAHKNGAQIWVRIHNRQIRKAVLAASKEAEAKGGFLAAKVIYLGTDPQAQNPANAAKHYEVLYQVGGDDLKPDYLPAPVLPDSVDGTDGGAVGSWNAAAPNPTEIAEVLDANPELREQMRQQLLGEGDGNGAEVDVNDLPF